MVAFIDGWIDILGAMAPFIWSLSHSLTYLITYEVVVDNESVCVFIFDLGYILCGRTGREGKEGKRIKKI